MSEALDSRYYISFSNITESSFSMKILIIFLINKKFNFLLTILHNYLIAFQNIKYQKILNLVYYVPSYFNNISFTTRIYRFIVQILIGCD